MSISVFDLFSIGVGPSSSHTMGPMRACLAFIEALDTQQQFDKVSRICVELYGSLALTGIGHGTDRAVIMGLMGETPEAVEPEKIPQAMAQLKEHTQLHLARRKYIHFNYESDLLFHCEKMLSYHSNGMKIYAFDDMGALLLSETYYSVGGGFITTEANYHLPNQDTTLPYMFNTAQQLVDCCRQHDLSIAEVMRANEQHWRPVEAIDTELDVIIDVMATAVERGLSTKGILPGGLNVRRRAAVLHEKLNQRDTTTSPDPTAAIDWLSAYAIAVNEENAAGGRVVTAPTNGAAGVIPAVLYFYRRFYPNFDQQKVRDFLLVAGAIAILYKHGASLSAAEVGCQGEIGVASSMAAGALTAVLGGSLAQITNAAEIAMEHHLGMTCDPINGLVQIPCIERNSMGAVKAVNACHLALLGDGEHYVSLDKVIATMKRTGLDMMTIYKETSLGGLAVNIPEC